MPPRVDANREQAETLRRANRARFDPRSYPSPRNTKPAKSRKANLNKSELAEYLKLSHGLEGLTEAKLKELAATKGWRELKL